MSLAVELPSQIPHGHSGGPAPDNCADLEALHREFYPRLVRVCTQQLRDRGLAEDIAQDTILRALRFWGSFDTERPTWPWLKTIAVRLCLDARRDRSYEVCLEAMPEHAEATDRTERLLDEITVRRAMAGLPERQRLALRLRYFDDRDRDSSAEVLGVNVNAFDQLLNRARLRLAHVIEPARAGASLGVLWLPVRWLRGRLRTRLLPRRARGGLATVAMGTMTTMPLAVAPLLAIVAGMGPSTSAQTYPAAHAFTAGQGLGRAAAGSRTSLRGRAQAPAGNGGAASSQNLKVGAAAGPAAANAGFAKHPLEHGRVETHQIVIETPVGDVTLEGRSDHYPGDDTVCRLPSVECSR